VTLKLKTPSLRILHVDDYDYIETLVGISAPKLEEISFLPNQPGHIEVDGELPCVGSLKVELWSHGYKDDINGGSIRLLRCRTSLTCLEVSLQVATVCIQSTALMIWLATSCNYSLKTKLEVSCFLFLLKMSLQDA
jgi:hypothetical protein